MKRYALKRFFLAFLCCAGLCGGASGAAPSMREAGDSIFGVGYVALDPKVAELYAQTGVRWIKLPDVKWGLIEPEPPQNGVHAYQFDLLDKIVRVYQANGFSLQLILSASNPWAGRDDKVSAVKGSFAENLATTPPKEEYWDDYAAFIAAVVERYDADSVDDMPGLVEPLRYFEIESEAQHFIHWQGSAEEYLRLLKIAYRAAKGADRRTQIILSGLNFGDLFDHIKSPDELARRFKALPAEYARALDFIKDTLAAVDHYDVIEFHYNRDYDGIYETVRWIRQYSHKPIWAGDAASAPWLFDGIFQKPYELPDRIFEKVMARQEPFLSWYRKEQAALTVKKYVVACEAGLKRVIMESTRPWKTTGRSPLAVDYMWDLQAMADEDLRPWPVFHTIKLLVEKIDGFESVRRMEAAGGVFLFEFETARGPVYIAWTDDHIAQGPEDAESKARRLDLSGVVPYPRLLVTSFPVRLDFQDEPQDPVAVSSADIIVSEMPIIIEPYTGGGE